MPTNQHIYRACLHSVCSQLLMLIDKTRRGAQHLIDRAKLIAQNGTIDFALNDPAAERRAHALAEILYRD